MLFQKELEYPCGAQRTRKEAENLLPADIEGCGSFVSAAVKEDFGREAKALFTHAALVRTPGELRMRRIRKRAFQRFGARMLPGGDRYGQEEQFFGMAARRPEEERESWLKKPLSPRCR